MPIASLVILVALTAAPTSGTEGMSEAERMALKNPDVIRLSLPTQADVDAWRNPGLRLQLGFGLGPMKGNGPAWSWSSVGVLVRPSVRLDDRWSVGLGLDYGTGPGGVRWSVTAEPSFFVWRQLAISAGLGFGGLQITDNTRKNAGLDVIAADESRDIRAGEKLVSCNGSAFSGLLRAEYLFVVGPLFSTGPFAQTRAQMTHCHQDLESVNESGQPVTVTQWWRHTGWTIGWWMAWR